MTHRLLNGVGVFAIAALIAVACSSPTNSPAAQRSSDSPATSAATPAPATAVTQAAPVGGPCDWVTTEEAADILDGPVHTRPHGDAAGSVEMSCDYSIGLGGNGMESGLKLPGSFPVDAASQFASATSASNATSVEGVGVKAVCVFEPTTTPPSTTVSVLLSGDRIYRVTGWYAMSCEQLTQVAQTAIGRIGA